MKHQSITSLPRSPEAERHSRMMKYLLAMGIRMLCIVAVLFVRGWWLIIPAAGAIFLPYFAVLIANAGSKNTTTVLRPGAIVRMSSTGVDSDANSNSQNDNENDNDNDNENDNENENRDSQTEEKP